MKIVYVGVQYNFYNPAQGLSFEHYNFYESLRSLEGVDDVVYIPYEDILKYGKKRWNSMLLERVKQEKPDLFFAFMLSDELEFHVLDEIKSRTTSVAWFADDHWRLHNYSRWYASHFTWAVTTWSKAKEYYAQYGITNIFCSQWAANTMIYRPTMKEENKTSSEVSFVGSWSKPRAYIIQKMKKARIPLNVYGGGWGSGRINETKMINLFSTSKINLGLNPAPGYWNVNSLGRLFLRRSINTFVPDFHIITNLKAWSCRGIPQIKARHFEIPACAGLLLTGFTDDLEKYYENGKEVVMYDSIDDAIEKINYYLVHKNEREAIARAGYARTIKDHTYHVRFKELFQAIRCPSFS